MRIYIYIYCLLIYWGVYACYCVLHAGENICTFIAEAPPQQQPKKPDASLAGRGRSMPAGRGVSAVPLSAAPVGLAGPVRGVGAPAPHQMVGGGPPIGRGPMGPPGMQPPVGSMPPMMRPPGSMM